MRVRLHLAEAEVGELVGIDAGRGQRRRFAEHPSADAGLAHLGLKNARLPKKGESGDDRDVECLCVGLSS